MAKMPASTTITCPACSADITIPLTSRWRATEVAFDTRPLRAHIAEHLAADERGAGRYVVSDNLTWRALRDDEPRREQILDWLRANGINPKDIPAKSTVAIEPGPDGGEVIRHTAYVRDGHGIPLEAGALATEERAVPLTVPLPGRAPSACDCTGSSAGLNACAACPNPWPDIPGATRIERGAAAPSKES